MFTKKITSALIFTGFVVGILVGAGALSGDELGRVNLLFFIFLFAVVPILSLVISSVLLLTKKSGIASLIMNLPFWPKRFGLHILPQELIGSKKNWLFLQSQCIVLAFAVGGLVVFFALLLGTDVNFVWRSTLLDAQTLLPALKIIALPWLFWADAQPSLGLLELSQNSRVAEEGNGYSANWWRFAVAAQIAYNLFPRLVMLLIAAWRYRQDIVAKSAGDVANAAVLTRHLSADTPPPLAGIAYTIPGGYELADWANLPDYCVISITEAFGSTKNKMSIDALTAAEKLQQRLETASLVVVVKSWEPPLAELKDVLDSLEHQNTYFILPLDWTDSSVVPIKTEHLNEWRRFTATLSDWQILLPGAHS
ncbi:MAG: hypothetical protein ACI9P7_000511 [Candidatus Azotimanducaceae bacterium]